MVHEVNINDNETSSIYDEMILYGRRTTRLQYMAYGNTFAALVNMALQHNKEVLSKLDMHIANHLGYDFMGFMMECQAA